MCYLLFLAWSWNEAQLYHLTVVIKFTSSLKVVEHGLAHTETLECIFPGYLGTNRLTFLALLYFGDFFTISFCVIHQLFFHNKTVRTLGEVIVLLGEFYRMDTIKARISTFSSVQTKG